MPGPTHRQFRAIYRAEFAFVWAVARRFGVPLAALDDAVQEVFITAFRRLDQLGYQVSQRAWLYAVTRRVASHHHRSATRRARRVAALAEAHADAVEAPHERHDAARALAGLLAPLPRSTREVWEMTEVLGMTGPEIAAELAVPLNTVYSRLRLARAQLGRAGPEVVAACVDDARRRGAPPAEAEQRNWLVILPVMQQGGIAAMVGAWVTLRGAVAGTLIVAGAAIITPVVFVEPPTRAPHQPIAADPPPSLPSPRAEVEAPAVVASPPPPAAVRRTTAADRLAAEVALIDRARGRLVAGEPAAALALLDRHAREFPDGALHDAREGANVEALCLLGERAGAEAAARRLFATYPDSLIAQNYEYYVCTSKDP